MNADVADLLLDTSIWVDWYRGRLEDISPATIQKSLEEDRLSTCGVVLFELLRGTRTQSEWRLVREDQLSLRFLRIDEEQFERSAALARDAGKRGYTMSLSVCLLAGLAIRYRLLLVSKDRDFLAFPELSLRLVSKKPS